MFQKIFRKIIIMLNGWLGLFIKLFEKEDKTIIVMVDGGLGSQINKYALGRYLEKKRDVKIEFDLDWFAKDGMSIDGKDTRNFDFLDVFPNVVFPVAKSDHSKKVKRFFRYLNSKPFLFNTKIIQKSTPLFVDGYYYHWKYLVDADVSKELEFSEKLKQQNSQVLSRILENKCPVSIHIRRGDYVNSAHDVVTADYFLHAIEEMSNRLAGEKPVFYFFSNGMDWVKENIISRVQDKISYVIIEENDNVNGASDLYLMSNCLHHICSNSSFSYFAAYLCKNENKEVIIPEEWMKNTKYSIGSAEAFRYPGWTVMSNNGELC